MFEAIELTYLLLVGIFSYFLMKNVFYEKMPMYYIKLPVYIVTATIFLIYYFNNDITYVNTSILSFFIMSVISQITVYRGYYWRITTGFGLGFTYIFFIVATYVEANLQFSELQALMLIIGVVLILTASMENSKIEKAYMIVLFTWAGTTYLYGNNILQIAFLMYAFSEMILLSHMKIKEKLNKEFRKKEKYLATDHGEEYVDLLDWEKILTSDIDYYVNKRGLYRKQLIHDYLASAISITAHIYLSLYYVL